MADGKHTMTANQAATAPEVPPTYLLRDALDSLHNSCDVLALLDDLLSHTADAQDITLSSSGAIGLAQLLRECREVGLAACAAYSVERQHDPDRQEKAQSRREGYVAGRDAALELLVKLQPEWEGQAKAALSRMPVPDLTELHDETAPIPKSNRA